MATIVCYQLVGSGFTDLDIPDKTYGIRIVDVNVDGPDGVGDTTVTIKYERAD